MLRIKKSKYPKFEDILTQYNEYYLFLTKLDSESLIFNCELIETKCNEIVVCD